MSTVESIFLGASILTVATGLIILAINPRRNINRAFAIAATISAIWLFCVSMAIHHGTAASSASGLDRTLFWLRLNNATIPYLVWSLFFIKLTILEDALFTRLLSRTWPLITASGFLAILAFTEYNIPSNSTHEAQTRGAGYLIQAIVTSSLCIVLLCQAHSQIKKLQGIRQLEIKFFLITTSLSALVILMAHTMGRLLNIPVLRYVSPFVVLASGALTIWAIFYHRIFDARQVFATLSRWLSILLVLTSCILITHRYLTGIVPEAFGLLVGIFCGALLAGFLDKKICRWLDLDPNIVLAAPRAQIVEWAREDADTDKLVTKFETFLQDWNQAEHVTLHAIESTEQLNRFLRTTAYAHDFPMLRQTGYITREMLDRRQPDDETLASKAILSDCNLAALIAVPRGSHSPSCLAAFGHKHSMRPYTYPDIQLLIELVELMDNILTQSRIAAHTAQIEKMESAAMMSRGLAHDLNNLATPVSTFLLHMEDRVKPGSAEAEVLADAKHSIRVMQDYIRESLFFARRLVPDFQRLSTSDLLASTIKLTQSRAQSRGVKVVSEAATDITLMADRALILRLLQNLVFNGIDASSRGAQVTLSVETVNHDRICFCVADQGSGVPTEIRNRIFEPYFTTKDTGDEIRGLGLGLAICLKISGLHGGEIRVGNATSGGALFTVCLPLTQNNPRDASSPPRESKSLSTALADRPAVENPAT